MLIIYLPEKFMYHIQEATKGSTFKTTSVFLQTLIWASSLSQLLMFLRGHDWWTYATCDKGSQVNPALF